MVDKPNDPKNTWSVEYHHLVPYVIKAVLEQQTQIQALSLNLQGNLSGDANQDEIAVVDMSFNGKLKVKSQVVFGQDTVGQVKILVGATEAQVNFNAPYEEQPIVTLTLASDNYLTKYFVSSASSTGFVVKIEPQQTEKPVILNWHAFGAEEAKVFVSDGTTEDIKLIVIEPTPAPAPVVESPPAAPAPEAPAPAVEPLAPPVEPPTPVAETTVPPAETPVTPVVESPAQPVEEPIAPVVEVLPLQSAETPPAMNEIEPPTTEITPPAEPSILIVEPAPAPEVEPTVEPTPPSPVETQSSEIIN